MRTVQCKVNEEWIDLAFSDIKEGMTLRFFDDDVPSYDGKEFVSAGEPYIGASGELEVKVV